MRDPLEKPVRWVRQVKEGMKLESTQFRHSVPLEISAETDRFQLEESVEDFLVH
jgi:hypothetical protein